MKKLLMAASLLVGSLAASHGQGTVLFQNITPVNAPFYDEGGVTGTTANRLQGTAFRAQLWAAAPGGTLAPVGDAVPFLTGSSGAGFFIGGSRAISAVVPGAPADVQVRVWRVTDGGMTVNAWDEAVARGRGFGCTPILTIATGGAGEPPAPPVQLIGLQGALIFGCVPEPSTVALGIVGGLGALWLFGYRRCSQP